MATSHDLLRPEANKAFEEILKERNIQDYSIKVSSGIKKGQKVAALVAQVHVNGYDCLGNSVQESFIIKSAPVNEEFRNARHIRSVFLREIYVYSEIFREFEFIQTEKCIINPFKSYPKYYTSTSQIGEESIVLQDLKLSGFKHCNREMPVDFDHAVIVMKEYGRLHALSYAIRDQKPELFKDIVNNTHETCFQNFQKPAVRAFSKDRVQQALKSLDLIKEQPVYKQFQKFSENMFEVLAKCVDSKSADEHAVVTHGDCSLNNFMFKYEDFENIQKPTYMRILNWQLTRLGSPAMDIATFIFSCTDKTLRDMHYDDLINEYYNTLCAMLEELGTDPMTMLPFSVLQQHLKRYSIFGLFMAIMLLFVQYTKKDEILDMLHDAIQSCFKFNQAESHNVRMRDIILDFDRLGYNFNFT